MSTPLPNALDPKLESIRRPSPGWGLGLRTQHYADFLERRQPVDWLEIITDNFLVAGGKPLVMLERIRRDHPIAMHGVAMSLGSAQGLDLDYLRAVKQLADRIDPLWISDHVCWTNWGGHCLHDLYPLPCTEEAADLLVRHIGQAQDVLQRRLVIENVSSYIQYRHDTLTEWDFLNHVCERADCLLLLDVNNIYVSGVNHRFDPLRYVHGIAAHRVQQIHLAGHSDKGDHIIDTHDEPVCEAVWQLYAQTCQAVGRVASMIERDDNIPALDELLAEVAHGRRIQQNAAPRIGVTGTGHACAVPWSATKSVAAQQDPNGQSHQVHQAQRQLAACVLSPTSPNSPDAHTQAPEAIGMLALIQAATPQAGLQRLQIYHHAYRARLLEVLMDTFEKTLRYMGTDLFEACALDYLQHNPPQDHKLSLLGQRWPGYLQERYPDNPELFEMARLDGDMRNRFDMADAPALTAAQVQSDTAQHWLTQTPSLHPSVIVRPIQSNVAQLWRAIHDDEEVPPAQALPQAQALIVWRKALQPHFLSVKGAEMAFWQHLQTGSSVADALETISSTATVDPIEASTWMQRAWHEGLLRN
jgi:uncharacterized protein (UPF0276 family)